MAEPCTITFYRPAGGWRDRWRAYRLVVDGSVVGEIRRGQTVRVPTVPGRHQVRARIDATGSPPVDVELPPGGEARFRVEPAGSALHASQARGSTSWLRLTLEDIAPGP